MATAEPRALFLFPDEAPCSDEEVCSGRYRDWLEGAPCPYAEDGRMPLPGGAVGAATGGSGPLPEGGRERPVGPQAGYPCVVERLGRLGDWRGQGELRFPPEFGRLMLFKCKQMFLLVVPALGVD